MIIVPTEKRFDWKHAPVFLFIIVALNVLVFFLYQSGDNQKLYSALESYQEHQFLEKEWPAFTAYLEQEGKTEELSEYKSLYAEDYHEDVAIGILMDFGFYRHMQRESRNLFYRDDLRKWEAARSEIHARVASISAFDHGLIASDFHFTSLITHQFLHGDIMHLLGNLFFLVVCGFAVEAALGHLRFVMFYLIGGVAAGLAQVAVDTQSDIPLIGASGAISAVMAMYLGVFRLKKIEFFYWFFVFVGYVRAPALLILPFYIGKEVYSFYADPDSNVAFMAHAGGFVAGAALILVSILINPKILNEEYIETDQDIDPRREKLAGVYTAMESYRFDRAWEILKELISEYGINFEYAVLRFNLFKLSRSKAYLKCLAEIIKFNRLMPEELEKVESLWLENPEVRDELDHKTLARFAIRMTGLANANTAKAIHKHLSEQGYGGDEMTLLAEKINYAARRTG